MRPTRLTALASRQAINRNPSGVFALVSCSDTLGSRRIERRADALEIRFLFMRDEYDVERHVTREHAGKVPARAARDFIRLTSRCPDAQRDSARCARLEAQLGEVGTSYGGRLAKLRTEHRLEIALTRTVLLPQELDTRLDT